jgi:hypothetical protein
MPLKRLTYLMPRHRQSSAARRRRIHRAAQVDSLPRDVDAHLSQLHSRLTVAFGSVNPFARYVEVFRR